MLQHRCHRVFACGEDFSYPKTSLRNLLAPDSLRQNTPALQSGSHSREIEPMGLFTVKIRHHTHEIELRLGLEGDFKRMTESYFASRREITRMKDNKVWERATCCYGGWLSFEKKHRDGRFHTMERSSGQFVRHIKKLPKPV
jgi:hypothetical protein